VHDRGERHEASHSVVEGDFVFFIFCFDGGHEEAHHPRVAELLRHFPDFGDAHFPHRCGRIAQIAHENWLQELEEAVLPELNGHVAEQLDARHANAPLRILRNVGNGGEELVRKHVLVHNVGNLNQVLDHVQPHLCVVVLHQGHQDWDDLLAGVVLANERRHLA